MSSYELIIFDCDGTLVDTEVVSSSASIIVLQRMGVACDKKYFQDNLVGISRVDLIEWAKERLNGYFDENKFIHEARIEADKLMGDIAIPGVDDMLSKISQHKVVASNGLRHRVINSLEKTNIKKYFEEDCIFTIEQVHAPKPAPDLFLLPVNKFLVTKEKAIILEDSIIGVMAANNAGIDVVVYASKEQQNDPVFSRKLKDCKVKAIIDHHSQFLDII